MSDTGVQRPGQLPSRYQFPPKTGQLPPSPTAKPLPPVPPTGTLPPRHFDIEATVRGKGNFATSDPAMSAESSDSLTSSSTWSTATMNQHFFHESKNKASMLLDSHDRFKPEKNQRHAVQKVKWSQSRLVRSLAGDLFSCSPPMASTEVRQAPNVIAGVNQKFLPHHLNSRNFLADRLPLESESRVSSMTIADVSPRLAVKKVLVLYEHSQYREAANFIQRLSVGTFRIILRELPVDILIEAMPHSLPILEALYSKVYTSDGAGMDLKPLKPDTTVLHMVKFFSQEEMWRERTRQNGKELVGHFTSGCKRILRIVLMGDTKVMKNLQARRKVLGKAVEGMGQHGLVGTTDESLLPLHDALKLDFRRVMDAYRGALQKLEDLSLSNKNNPKSVCHGPAPIQASHQRQLSLRAEEIEERLIKNKSLLNVVEPTLGNHCLDILLGILQRRIDCDKDALFHYTQLRKEVGDLNSETHVAPYLMRYSTAFKKVLDLMKETAEEGDGSLSCPGDDSSDLSGYHSDSDSAMMSSGNSPFMSPRARFNFLSRSVRCKTLLRPSLAINYSSASSGIGSGDSRPPSSKKEMTSSDYISHGGSNPTRARTIKQRNQLHKNNSLASNSSGDSESLEVSSMRSAEESLLLAQSSLEYVTVVSVPENQVLSQGSHRLTPLSEPRPPADNRITELRNEINQLKQSLLKANASIKVFQDKEKLVDESSLVSLKGREDRRSLCIRQYGALYATTRVETMDVLDSMPELASADELKSKLLFSVVVLSFRAVEYSVNELLRRMESALQVNDGRGKGYIGKCPLTKSLHEEEILGQRKLMEALGDYLNATCPKPHVTKAVEQVANQLWNTLYDYPCLKACHGLLKYIRACVTLSWSLSTLSPPCRLEYETRLFRRDMHVRFPSGDASCDQIKSYLWPVLVQGTTCLHKGIVIT